MNRLYGYFRSSCSYRVRLALAYKQLAVESFAVNLRVGEQQQAMYLGLNPQGLVPALLIDEEGEKEGAQLLTQSLAIIEYLEDCHPQWALLPSEPLARARVKALAYQLATDVQPLNNLRVLSYLENTLDVSAEQKVAWYQHWVEDGFTSIEEQLRNQRQQQKYAGPYCFGRSISLADICLVPQVYNALRFDCNMSNYPTLQAIYQACLARDDFQRAAPEQQADAPHAL